MVQGWLAINFNDANGLTCHLIFGEPAPGYEDTTDATVVGNTNGTWTYTTFATDVAKLTCDEKHGTITEGYFFMPTQFTAAKM